MGAHFTECPPDYGRDEAFQREYAATAKDPEAWAQFELTGSNSNHTRRTEPSSRKGGRRE